MNNQIMYWQNERDISLVSTKDFVYGNVWNDISENTFQTEIDNINQQLAESLQQNWDEYLNNNYDQFEYGIEDNSFKYNAIRKVKIEPTAPGVEGEFDPCPDNGCAI